MKTFEEANPLLNLESGSPTSGSEEAVLYMCST